jgi:hypothetical protein
MTRSIRLVAGSSSPVLRAGYETKMNVEKHECSLLKVVSDVGSTPTASTISYILRILIQPLRRGCCFACRTGWDRSGRRVERIRLYWWNRSGAKTYRLLLQVCHSCEVPGEM